MCAYVERARIITPGTRRISVRIGILSVGQQHATTCHTPDIDGAWTWEDDYREAFPTAVMHIRDLLDGTTENLSSGEDALQSLEIIVGFYVSHYTGSHVTMPLDRPLRDVTITSW